ncbi:MAG TPA: hypothetical protein VN372_13835 [Methanospirillum sp.]|nr:hypothetical protein [Methanospirillum sp.]
MSSGRFEKGMWIEETEEETNDPSSSQNLEKRVSAATETFGRGLDDLISVSKELLTTEEGRKHIGKKMDQASGEVISTLEETARKATDYINKLLEQTRK